jgi:hypothetical protein
VAGFGPGPTRAAQIGAENAPMPPRGAAVGEPGAAPQIPGTPLAPNLMSKTPLYREPSYSQTELTSNQPEWAKQNAEMVGTIGQSQQAEQRLFSIADAFKQIQSGAFATDKAAFNAAMQGIFGQNAYQLEGADPATIETALHENYKATLQQLKTVNNRFTQREFAVLSEQSEHPDLQPAANLKMLTEDIGTLRQMRGMATDWANYRAAGYQDPEIFQTKWLNANPLPPIVSAVRSEIGPLKGMQGQPAVEGQVYGHPDGTQVQVKGRQLIDVTPGSKNYGKPYQPPGQR